MSSLSAPDPRVYLLAALRAADLGARTTPVTRAEFGGMAQERSRAFGKRNT